MDFYVFGTNYFGKCEVVPGMLYIATYFAHVAFIPIVPLHSFIITHERDEKYFGVEIPVLWKSVLLAWARYLTFAFFFVASIMAFAAWHHSFAATAIIAGVVAVSSFAAYLALMIVPRRPVSYQRACELGLQANLDSILWTILHEKYAKAAEPKVDNDYSHSVNADGNYLLRPTDVKQKKRSR